MLKLIEKYAKEVENKYPIEVGVYEDKEMNACSILLSYNNKGFKLRERRMIRLNNNTIVNDETYAKYIIDEYCNGFIGEIKDICNSILSDLKDFKGV